MPDFNPIIHTSDDDLIIPEVGPWSIIKYKHVGHYCNIFTTSMRRKWNNLVYIDLFAGSGYSIVGDRVLYGSPLISLSIPNPFTKYIFCEKEPELALALETRIDRTFAESNSVVLRGDSNEIINQVKEEIPKYSRGNTVLSFAFVDPFSLNLDFSTIAKLGESLKIDFLILLALHMDAKRNFGKYFDRESHKVESFLGDPKWRENIDDSMKSYSGFVKFLGDSYRRKMTNLGYNATDEFVGVKYDDRLPLYYLAYFSKDKLGSKFWREVQKSSSDQKGLF